WTDQPVLHTFYRKLLGLRKDHPALLGHDEHSFTWRIATDHPDEVFCFVRKNKEQELLVVLNFSEKPVNLVLHDLRVRGEFSDIFSNEKKEAADTFTLESWGYKVMIK
ncbi:MAG TPA: DUF3459 domain-containing protein, partial [Lacibacter sp.]|nr:DUF3459 domain-containing protein [Lacibacter sp.]